MKDVIVKDKALEQEMYYKNTVIMRYTIKYPMFLSGKYQTLLNKLNSFYRTKALMYERTNVVNLYQMAMVDYEYSIANNYPVRESEAYVDYEITYNKDCAISLYFDQYEYAGGAHGLTVRSSDTWDLQKSKRLDLEDIFPNHRNYREYVIQEIIMQIENQLKNKQSLYFDDYVKRVEESFRSNHFYLTEEGVVIYFQQYDIAPYAAGMPTFLIPYTKEGARRPKCFT